MIGGDVIVMVIIVLFEYLNVIKDFKKFCFVGGLFVRVLDKNFVYFFWWEEFMFNSVFFDFDLVKKKVVFVIQGIVYCVYYELMILVIQVMVDREDVLVVVILGEKGELNFLLEEEIFRNVRMVDYFFYEVIFFYVDVFVFNVGYGGFMYGIMNGVLMVLVGLIVDKGDVCQWVVRVGVVVNLGVFNLLVE